MTRIGVVLEPVNGGFSVYAPDVPGCVSFGESHAQALNNMREALEGHFETMREHGEVMPAFDTSNVAVIEVDAAR
jgi:predicted RNase H-like HicB family nuclease